MSDITESEWRLIRQVFGDLAYEEPHNHVDMLAAARLAALRENKEAKIAAAMVVLDRVPDVPSDAGDELK
ncbi:MULTISPECIES: hypothetical protein [Rhizobium/Agrobacterium group]|uniref:Uncharacterized protein n=1 Tax=Agrobacterium genomosp. 2 str. CFBP 5494 TaxID=1183436 RepID=A0A9W5AZJ4_9HYPH|nr:MULTISPECIES: hypothetical protein [Rhizobium/Agrobacterium group]CAD7036292.1 hypothetical protein RP007_04437 [Rhizobium sp. P007]CUW88569.1 hypothetical protein AGR2A_Cc140102 [Agrobacterium genomosp. 2 str. CFBP 5494]